MINVFVFIYWTEWIKRLIWRTLIIKIMNIDAFNLIVKLIIFYLFIHCAWEKFFFWFCKAIMIQKFFRCWWLKKKLIQLILLFLQFFRKIHHFSYWRIVWEKKLFLIAQRYSSFMGCAIHFLKNALIRKNFRFFLTLLKLLRILIFFFAFRLRLFNMINLFRFKLNNYRRIKLYFRRTNNFLTWILLTFSTRWRWLLLICHIV